MYTYRSPKLNPSLSDLSLSCDISEKTSNLNFSLTLSRCNWNFTKQKTSSGQTRKYSPHLPRNVFGFRWKCQRMPDRVEFARARFTVVVMLYANEIFVSRLQLELYVAPCSKNLVHDMLLKWFRCEVFVRIRQFLLSRRVDLHRHTCTSYVCYVHMTTHVREPRQRSSIALPLFVFLVFFGSFLWRLEMNLGELFFVKSQKSQASIPPCIVVLCIFERPTVPVCTRHVPPFRHYRFTDLPKSFNRASSCQQLEEMMVYVCTFMK